MKQILLLLCGLWAAIGSAQDANEISIEQADALFFNRKNEGYQRLIGNVILKQDSTYLYCDSAHFYNELNRAIAYSNVRMISSGSTLNCRVLRYDGGSKRGRAHGEVVLQSNRSTLLTDTLYFNRLANEAYFTHYGELHRENARIQAVRGAYFMNEDRAEFTDSVQVFDGGTRIFTDSLIHFSEWRITHLYTRSKIWLDSTLIESNLATLNHDSSFYRFWGEVRVDEPGTHLEGDSLVFDQEHGRFWGFGDVYWMDSLAHRGLKGPFVHVNDSLGFARATGFPRVLLIEENDTLHLGADSIFIDGLDDRPHFLRASNRVVFYRSDLQGRCDSLIYRSADSTMELFRDPILWADEFQITADSVRLHFKNDLAHQFDAVGHGFTVGKKSERRYDQIKGRSITGFFNDAGELSEIEVRGNGETIYFGTEESGDIVGMDRTECSSMRIRVLDRTLSDITFFNQPKGLFIPMSEVNSTNEHLKDFEWFQHLRPQSPADIYPGFPTRSE